MRSIILFLSLIFFESVYAQKTSNYYQYGLFSSDAVSNLFENSIVNPIKSSEAKRQYYWTVSGNTPTSSSTLKMDSLVLSGIDKKSRNACDLKTKTNQDILLFFMENDSIVWNLTISITNRNGKIGSVNLLNTKTAGDRLLVYLQVKSDSLNCFTNNGVTINSWNCTSDSFSYVLLNFDKFGNAKLENKHVEKYGMSTDLVWANETKYVLSFRNSYWPYPSLKTYKKIPQTGRLLDSQVTSFVLQYDLGDAAIKNWISGTIPNSVDSRSCFITGGDEKDLILGGVYESNAISGNFFPHKPIYKLNNNSTVSISKPNGFSRGKNYLYWMKLDVQTWVINEVQFAIPNQKQFPKIINYGRLKDGYWFLGYFDSVALDAPNLIWKKCPLKNSTDGVSLFTYSPKNKQINTSGFPNGLAGVYSDGDSLLFIFGDNGDLNGSNEMVDIDPSAAYKYPIKAGKYAAEFTLAGDLVWARNENFYSSAGGSRNVFYAGNGARFISPGTLVDMTDLDFGFRKLGNVVISNFAGNVIELSKTPICDFDIDTVIYNHVFINYKGALNAQYYFKFGDNSTDSNLNQRYFTHSYKKTGSYLIQCIAKNDYGSDTAYYSVKINDIVSSSKLQKNRNIQFYPNPKQNTISWNVNNTTSVEIFNTSGSLVRKIETVQSSLSLEDLSAGVYIIVVNSDKGSFYNRVIKQ
jgi:hypothetical protein